MNKNVWGGGKKGVNTTEVMQGEGSDTHKPRVGLPQDRPRSVSAIQNTTKHRINGYQLTNESCIDHTHTHMTNTGMINNTPLSIYLITGRGEAV